jgi:hypothetical protein
MDVSSQEWDVYLRSIMDMSVTYNRTMSLESPDGTTTVAQVMNRMTLSRVAMINQHQQTEQFRQWVHSTEMDMRRRHHSEMEDARRVAEQYHAEALAQNRNASVYANAVALLGERATDEIRTRDFECYRLQHMCQYLENRGFESEHHMCLFMQEANERIQFDALHIRRCENEMQSFRQELAVSHRHLEHQAQSIAQFGQIQHHLPRLDERFRAMGTELQEAQGRYQQELFNERLGCRTEMGAMRDRYDTELAQERKRM